MSNICEGSSISLDRSMTKEKLEFSSGEDVLVQLEDGKFYLGTIEELDLAGGKCLIKFLNNTSTLSSLTELKKLSSEPSITCILCKKSDSINGNEIIACNDCGRGYHELCHQPQIFKENHFDGKEWKCKKCRFKWNKHLKEKKRSMIKLGIRKVCSGRDKPLPPLESIKNLPYNLDMLHWDSLHRINAEQIYCYCGLNGEWYTQMLQCIRCKQWFHENCISCLVKPLYNGDRFYVFVCSMCNNGIEFVRRLELKWIDLVHLILFNLTVNNTKKYYDLDTEIIPYAESNWDNLQLLPNMHNKNRNEIRELILDALTSNKKRFKCGKEIKKCNSIWGLRDRLPPPCPIVSLPKTGIIDDNVLSNRLEFLSPMSESLGVRPLKLNLDPRTKILDFLSNSCPEIKTISSQEYS